MTLRAVCDRESHDERLAYGCRQGVDSKLTGEKTASELVSESWHGQANFRSSRTRQQATCLGNELSDLRLGCKEGGVAGSSWSDQLEVLALAEHTTYHSTSRGPFIKSVTEQ